MSGKEKDILSTLQVGSHIYKNRIVAAPIYCGTFVLIPPLAKVLIQSVTEKALGGCAQVTIGETPVDFEYASREPFPPIDYCNFDHPAIDPMKKATNIIKSNGAIAMIELSHCGESKLSIAGAGNAIGPMGYTREDGVLVVAMDEDMMQSVCDNFVSAAKFMQHAGFDGVMIHAGHGWLLHQFLSARTNRRADGYGGSLANRSKFPLQVIKSVRNALGKDFLIEVRVSGDEQTENGMGVVEVAAFCAMAQEYADLIHVSVGLYRDPVLSGQFSSLFEPHALNADMAKIIKKSVSIPVTVVGGINSAKTAIELLSDGKCDLVAMARELTADPDFANKFAQGLSDDITPCLRCFKCFPGPLEDNLDDLINLFGCTVNPKAFFFDEELLNTKPQGIKSVLIVGGGIAGMEAAIVAHDRGHKVTIVEKTGALGGLLKFADNDVYKKDLCAFKNLMVRRVQKRDIIIQLNTACNADNIKDYKADQVIIAVGSSAITPKIQGIENAIPALKAYEDIDALGNNVVVVGGGLVGCESGLNIAKSGRKVIIVDMADQMAPDSYPMHRLALMKEMDKMLDYRTGLRCTQIRSDGITVEDNNGNAIEITADSVIYALGMKSQDAIADELANAAGVPVTTVGDCVRPSKVYDGMREAFVAALSI